ncbi:ATP-binding cassette domain-containing protein [Fervidicoccus fontis]|uniref:ATP-binding cassette domain-containing protein n=1 Tax=Fervidicoccus fontis TaxID=683846 RepID=UPI00244DDD56|nr:ATP-binding cassette domain-containing protein [Fervidicoccus fontis]
MYDKSVKALDDLSFDVEEESIHALLGPNGAGKTTLIRILTTQLTPTKGTAYIFGLDVRKNPQQARGMLGYVPQEVSLWTDLTGYENLLIYSKIYEIPKSERVKRIEEALDFMDLKDASRRLVKTYSGGMFRRLEIAAALMVRPKILILDEPTIGLDPIARNNVWERVISYKKEFGTTVLFATHYMDEADKYADMITIINKGKQVISGKPEDLKMIIGGDRVTLKVDNKEKVKAIIAENFGIDIIEENSDVLTFLVEKSQLVLPRILSALEAEKIEVKELRIREASLNDVFIKLMGKRIEEEEEGRMKELISERKMIRMGG